MLKAKHDEWRAEIDKLAEKADQTEAKIAELQKTQGDAWEDLKQGVENSWEILKISFGRAKARFEQGYREGLKGDEDETQKND